MIIKFLSGSLYTITKQLRKGLNNGSPPPLIRSNGLPKSNNQKQQMNPGLAMSLYNICKINGK